MLAIGFMGYRHHALRYGHIWDYIYAFYCAVVRVRAETARARELRVFVPAGKVRCSQEHVALLALFGSARALRAFGFTLERAPWVPSCISLSKACYAHGGVPAELRGRVALLSNFAVGPPRLTPEKQVLFRARVHDALGLGDAPPMTILYVRSRDWPTRRSVHAEERVVDALAEWAAREHPYLRFVAEHVHKLGYAEEVAAFADARVLISLWGSALHNCRYMREGSTVVELLGALDGKYGDTAIYSQACARSAGLRHVPYGVPGAYPRAGGPQSEQPTDAVSARVDPQRLVGFMRRVFPNDPCAQPDWAALFGEFHAFIAKQVHPHTKRPPPTLGRAFIRGPLPPQYAERPWCNRGRIA